MTAERLREQLVSIERQFQGRIAIDVRRLDKPGRFSMRERDVLPTASTCKLFVLCELFRQAEAGEVDLDSPVAARPEMWCPGAGVLRAMRLDESLSAYNMAVLMIALSDNVATVALVDRLGADRIEHTAHEWGFTETTLAQGLASWTQTDGVGPTSNAYDLCLLLARIYRREILNAASCEEILKILRAQRCNEMLPRFIPIGEEWGVADEWIASKTGYNGCAVDTGIVHTQHCTFSLAVFFRLNEYVKPRYKCLADHPRVVAVAEACRCIYEHYSANNRSNGR